MASEIINNAVAGPESVPVAPGIGGVPAGLDPSSPDAQKALSDYGRSAGYIGKSLATGMAAGTQAAQGATNPLSAFMQGMSAGLQAPAQVFQAKRNQIQSAFEATPFGVTHPEVIADHPELKMLAGLPTGLVMPAIATIAVQSAKVYEEKKAALETQANAAKNEVITDPVELESYSKLTGLPKEYIQKVRKADVMAFAKAQGEGAGKANEDLLKLKTAFDTRPAVSAWNAVKPETNTVDSLGRILASKGTLTPQEQLQLSLSFKAIAASAGGAGRMTEDTLAIVENKGNWGQIVDKIFSGAAVSLSPSEARDVINASHLKVNQIKAGYVDEKNKWNSTILKDNQQAKDFLYDESVNKPSEDMGAMVKKPGDLVTRKENGDIVVYEIQADGKTAVRVK